MKKDAPMMRRPDSGFLIQIKAAARCVAAPDR
jgi:hypothetical protein